MLTQPDCITAYPVVLGGPVTVRNIHSVHAWLLEALRRNPAVEIDCSAVTDVDLSLVQTILAARRSAAAFGATLTLAHPASGALLDTLTRAGLLGGPSNDDAFWLNKE